MSNLSGHEVISRFTRAMRDHGIEPEATIIADGQRHRFRVAGDKPGSENGWYVLHLDGVPAGAFGCWKRDISETWCAADKASLSDTEKRELSARIKDQKREQEAERQRMRAECKARAEALWNGATGDAAADHPYLVAKGVRPYGLRQSDNKLLVPVRDADGTLVSLQLIGPNGSKTFLPGTPKAGNYCYIAGTPERVLICEGFATGASLHEATGHSVAVAFDCGNLLRVAKAIRARFPNAILVLCADDDRANPRNPGMTKAREAAQAVGGLVTAPAFLAGDLGTDFNDLHQRHGLEAVVTCVASADTPGPKSDDQSGSGLVLLRASDIKPEPVSWLWPEWLARGKLAILAGNPGSGKTTLALGLAAIITTAGRWPDKTPCHDKGSVFIWSGEDDPTDTLVPRLMAAGADLTRVHFLDGVTTDGERRPFDPGKDVPHLAAALEKVGDVRLIIIDPIVSAVTGDGHKANDVRRSLQPIVDYAMRHQCAVVGITHFSKGTGGRDPLERVTGSQAYGALARVVMVAAKEEGDGGSRVLARAKSNIGPDDGGVSYTIETTTVDGGIVASRAIWTGTMAGTARDILGIVESQEEGRSATDEAVDFLRDLLNQGPVPSKEANKQAKESGITEKTLRRAREKLDVVVDKSGYQGAWLWSLPPKDAHASSKMPIQDGGAPLEKLGIFEESCAAADLTLAPHSPTGIRFDEGAI